MHIAGDVMFHDRKFKSALEAPATTRILAFGNGVPKFQDRTDAMPRRLRIIPCNVRIKGKPDRQLVQKLVAEAPGILNEVVRAAIRLAERGGEFAVPQVCRDAEREYWLENDPVRLFLEQYTVLNPKCFSPTQWLFNHYKTVMDEWGWKYPVWIEEFGRQLKHYYAAEIASGDVRHRKASEAWVNSHSVYYRSGERPRGFEGVEMLRVPVGATKEEEIPF